MGKDQSYVLYNLTQEQLAHVRLPLGGLHKVEVREIAEKQHFINARKHDSQDICFVPDGDYARFMEDFTGKHYPAGDFLDENGKKVGTHNGAVRYTIGQRKGLGVGGIAGEDANRWYVVDKDLEHNRLIVSSGEGEELFSSGLIASGVNIIGKWDKKTFNCTAKFRYRQGEQEVFAHIDGDKLSVEFQKPQRAVTPGQYVVLYTQSDLSEKRRCLGGAVIDTVIK